MGGSKVADSYEVSYSSFSGCDIVASITIPKFATRPLVIGELQTISYSIHREKVPVRTLGRVNPRSFTYGQRTIAGSLIFTVFDSNLVHKIVRIIKESYNANYDPSSIDLYSERIDDIGNFSVMDEMPPFDITISLTNEYGKHSTLVIKGVVVVDEGQVMSIEDMITENTMSYMATDIQVLESKGKIASTEAVRAPIPAPSDTTLKHLSVSTGEMPKFDPGVFSYTVLLPEGTVVPPNIVAVANNASSTVEIYLADTISGTSRIRVRGEDNRTSEYYIRYKLVNRDASLANLTINGITVDGFSPMVYNYNVELDGLKAAPKVEGTLNDSNAKILVNRTFVLPGTTELIVTADDNSTQKIYSVNFSLTPQDGSALLANVATSIGYIDPPFASETFNYNIITPQGNTTVPLLNARLVDLSSAIAIDQPRGLTGSDAVGTITVTSTSNENTYTFTITEES